MFAVTLWVGRTKMCWVAERPARPVEMISVGWTSSCAGVVQAERVVAADVRPLHVRAAAGRSHTHWSPTL